MVVKSFWNHSASDDGWNSELTTLSFLKSELLSYEESESNDMDVDSSSDNASGEVQSDEQMAQAQKENIEVGPIFQIIRFED